MCGGSGVRTRLFRVSDGRIFQRLLNHHDIQNIILSANSLHCNRILVGSANPGTKALLGRLEGMLAHRPSPTVKELEAKAWAQGKE